MKEGTVIHACSPECEKTHVVVNLNLIHDSGERSLAELWSDAVAAANQQNHITHQIFERLAKSKS